MDPLSSQKIEQPTEMIPSKPTPETKPVVEVVEKVAEKQGSNVAESLNAEELSSVEPEPVKEQVPVAPVSTPVNLPEPQKDRITKEIEEVMEEDLKELYLSMPKNKQVEFRKKGEETMSAIRVLVRAAHINVKKIFQLIRAWLKIIPGVNRYFLEQEAKIKTDKIIFVSEEEKKRGSKL